MSEIFRKIRKYLNRKLFPHSSRPSPSTLTPCPLNLSDGSYSSLELVSTHLSSSSPFSENLHKQVSKDACAICLVKMEIGQEAIFTSECSHSFHFNCIVSNVEYGNNFCPICRTKWKSLPFKAPTMDESELDELLLDACRHPFPPPAPTPSAS